MEESAVNQGKVVNGHGHFTPCRSGVFFFFHTSTLLLFYLASVLVHGCAYFSSHNGKLLRAILGMSGHCCMFSHWLFSEIPLMNRK